MSRRALILTPLRPARGRNVVTDTHFSTGGLMKTIRNILIASLLLGMVPAGTVFAQEEELPEITLTWWINPWRIRPPGFPADQSPTGEEFPAWISEEFMKLHTNVTVVFEVVQNSGYLEKINKAQYAVYSPEVIHILAITS